MQNIDDLKKEVSEYMTGAHYAADLISELGTAEYKIKEYRNAGKSIILDIDDTLISLYPIIEAYDDGWCAASLNECMTRTDLPAIPETKVFLSNCLNDGFIIHILSSRRVMYLQNVEQLLENAGVRYHYLHLRADDDKGTIQDFKTNARKSLTEQGFDIVMNVGDQQTDLDGGYSLYTCKVPNYWYKIYADMIDEFFKKNN